MSFMSTIATLGMGTGPSARTSITPRRTIFDAIWDDHVVSTLEDGRDLLAIDLHLVHEVTSPQAFTNLRLSGRKVRRPDATLAVADHNVPTEHQDRPINDPASRQQVAALNDNAEHFGIPYAPLTGADHGIVHVIGPELGLTQPGMTIVCADSHTSTHGAFGALAFGIGTSEAEHVLATQTLAQRRPKTMRIDVDGELGANVYAKDLVLALIGQIGTGGATGHVVEYAGRCIERMEMAARMTICNMTIEAGARAGLIAPDEITYAYLAEHGRMSADAFVRAKKYWSSLRSDADASYDRRVRIDAAAVAPMVTWGTSPEAVTSIDGAVPLTSSIDDDEKRAQHEAMLRYMGLESGQRLVGIPIDVVFIGSCTNSRIEDLRSAAEIVRGRHVASGVRALVVPGSRRVKLAAEAEGLAAIFLEAGFQWREAGCSMCLGMNADRLAPGERCASTSNRNFEGRQGPGGRTHLMSPAMAAAAAVSGRLVDVRGLAR
jgi:3-isopropylmalate/(R)-2-methylmalate dehydratase large subunit